MILKKSKISNSNKDAIIYDGEADILPKSPKEEDKISPSKEAKLPYNNCGYHGTFLQLKAMGILH